MDRPLQETFETVPIPLYDAPDTLIQDKNAEGTGFGSSQCYVNMIPKMIKNVGTGEQHVYLEKRQGLDNNMNVLTKSGQAGAISGRDLITMTQLSDVMVGAYYRNNGGTKTIEIYQIRPTANTVVVIGTISTVAGPPAVNVSQTTDVYLTEIKIGNVPGVGIIITDSSGSAGTSAGYYALSAAGVFAAASLTKIADADFPTNQTPYLHVVGPFQQMNEITYIMVSDGRIFNSNDDSIGVWSALGFLEAESYADKGVGLYRYKHHILGVGASSIEFFDDVGNDPTLGSPLERTEQAFIKFGAIYGKAVINVDDVIYWIASSGNNTIGVWRLDGYTQVKISIHEVDNFLSRAGETLTPNVYCLQQVLLNNEKQVLVQATLQQNDFINRIFNSVGSTSYMPSEPQWTNISTYSGTYCFNIDSQIWWNFNTASYNEYVSVTNTAHLYCASIGSTTYAFMATPNLVSPMNENRRLFFISFTNFGLPFGDYTETAAGFDYFLAGYGTNFLYFGTNKRKFCHKIRLMHKGSPPSSSSDTEYINIALYRDSLNFLSGQSVTNKTRKYRWHSTTSLPFVSLNQFGAFFKAKFLVGYVGLASYGIDGIEADLEQGTN